MKIIKFLLDNGLDIDFQNNTNGESAIMRATHFNSQEVLRFLLTYNPNLELRNNLSATALHIAIYRNKPELVTILLNYGARFTIKEYNKGKSIYY